MELTQALESTPTGERERLDRASGRLRGSRCRDCDAVSWPARAVCHRCGSAAAEPLELTDRGQLITHTTVWVSRPGLEAPFTLGQIELPEGVTVFGHVRELEATDLVPLPVRMVLAAEADEVPPFWFEPERAA
jgi:uncharacterized OB-fold protein